MARGVKRPRPALLDAVIDGDAKMLERLLAQGADVNVQDSAGWSALHFAAQRQDADQIRRLLAAGADVEATDAYGNTPLFRAVYCYEGDAEPIRTLKAAGADESHLNGSGVSPRSLAESIANYDVATVL